MGTVHKGRSGHRARQHSGAITRPQPGHRGSQNSGATTCTQPGSNTACSRCGKYPAHDRQHCPAKDATCHKCNKRGHFQTVCKSAAKVGGVQAHSEPGDSSHDAFLGMLGEQSAQESNPWAVTLKLQGKSVDLHIDTGAEVTVISEQVWKDIGQPPVAI